MYPQVYWLFRSFSNQYILVDTLTKEMISKVVKEDLCKYDGMSESADKIGGCRICQIKYVMERQLVCFLMEIQGQKRIPQPKKHLCRELHQHALTLTCFLVIECRLVVPGTTALIHV